MGPNARGALLALLAFAFYSSHDVVVKVLGGVYSPFQVLFFSVFFSFPLALLTIMRDTEPGTLLPVHPWWIGFRTLAAVLTGVCAFYAFSVLPLAQVYSIVFATPLLITVMAIPILGEKVRLRRWMAVLVGLVGVIVVLQPGQTELTLGHLAALGTAVGGAFAAVVLRKIGREERPVVVMVYPMVANFIAMGAILGFVYKPMPFEHLAAVAVMSVLGYLGGMVLIGAYKAGEAVIIAPMQYSQIVWASIFGLAFFGESMDRYTLIGAAIIIASGLYIVLREGRAGASDNRPVLDTRARIETGVRPRQLIPTMRGISGRSL